jgi:hypothetical protein
LNSLILGIWQDGLGISAGASTGDYSWSYVLSTSVIFCYSYSGLLEIYGIQVCSGAKLIFPEGG